MAVITPFGLYEFLQMPFGLKNAAQAFQQQMDIVCRGLCGIFVYLDDILIASSSHKQHLQHIRVLFNCLKQYGLMVKLAKCIFGIPEIDFLSHHINCQDTIPLPEKVAKVCDFAWPTTVHSLQEFVGMVNFYHQFVPATAQLMWPLIATFLGRVQQSALLDRGHVAGFQCNQASAG